MLIDIYARSMMTATRHPCVEVRDLVAPASKPQDLAQKEITDKGFSAVFARMIKRIKYLTTGLRPTVRHLNQPVRCIDLQNL